MLWHRTIKSLAVMIVVSALLAADLSVGAAPAEASPRSSEEQFVELVNAEREQRGLRRLEVNALLRDVARDWSDQMAACARDGARGSCLEHRPRLDREVDARVTDEWKRLGENVGYTVKTGATTSYLTQRLHDNLMDSKGHRANILGDYNQIGVGVTIAADGTLWVTQNFMKAPISDDAVKSDSETAPVDVSGDAIPITGDWNGDGRATPGWYDNGRVLLRNSHGKGGADLSYIYGRAGDLPIVGDWNGDGVDTLGLLRDGRWYLRNAHASGSADVDFIYGRLRAGDYALAGDWNGDGRDTIGIVRDGEWHLRDKLAGGTADRVFIYGRVRAGDVPVVGDWTGDGRDTPGIIRGREWHLRHANRGGRADEVFLYGTTSDVPVVGDWNGKGATTPGIVRDQEWHLRNSNSGGKASLTYPF